jgi:hypothetical protein
MNMIIAGARAVAGAAFDASLLAALCLGVLDWAAALARGEAAPWHLPHVLAIVATASLLAAPLALLAALASRASLSRWVGRLAVFAASAVAAMPLLGIGLLVAQSGRFPALAAAAIAGAIAAFVAGAVVGFRLGRPIAWLAAVLVASVLARELGDSVAAFSRGDETSPGRLLLPVAAGEVVVLGLAFVLARAVTAIDGARPGRLLASAALVAGLAAALVAELEIPPQYPTARRFAFVAAFALLALAASRLSGLRLPRFRLAVAAVAVAGAATLFVALTPISPAAWAISGGTVLSRELVRAAGGFWIGYRRLVSDLDSRPEAALGRDARHDAAAWNREAPRLPYDPGELSAILVTVDALRYDHAGFSGLESAKGLTPEIDRLAERSHRYHRAYAQGAWTSLSMPSILWSRYPRDIPFTPVLEDSRRNLYFPAEVRPDTRAIHVLYAPVGETHDNLPSVLAAGGLATVSVANDGSSRFFAPRMGYAKGFKRFVYPRDALHRAAVADPDVPDADAAGLVVEELRRAGGGRFFMWVHFFDPHDWPRLLPYASYAERYRQAVRDADAAVGRLIDALAETGLDRRTIVVLTADHGEQVGERGTIGHGLDLYDETVRVPLLVAVPGIPPADHREPVGLIDVAPTVIHLLGLAVPDSMAGFSLAGGMVGSQRGERPPVAIETWRYEVDDPDRSIDLVGAVRGSDKVVLDRLLSAAALYDLASDPGEARNLLGSGDDAAIERFSSLAAWLVGLGGLRGETQAPAAQEARHR